jgi:hypothetical protein
LLEGVAKEVVYKHAGRHPDYNQFKQWQSTRNACLSEMEKRGLAIDKSTIDVRKDTKHEMVRDWLADRELYPKDSSIMLANSKNEVRDLNVIAREGLRVKGVISRQETLLQVKVEEDIGLGRKETVVKQVGFSVGDQVIFRSNDNGLKVSNGNLGVIHEIKGRNVTVKLNGPDERVVSFANSLYPYIEHGWATTITSSQACTFDRVKCLASFEMYRNLVYVASSRHRTDCKIYGSALEFHSMNNLKERLSRDNEKLLTSDYVVSKEEASLRLQDDQVKCLTMEEAAKLAGEERTILEKAEKVLLRVKEGGHAISHFVTGLFKDRSDDIKVEVYGNRAEAERAIDKLGLRAATTSSEKDNIQQANDSSLHLVQKALERAEQPRSESYNSAARTGQLGGSRNAAEFVRQASAYAGDGIVPSDLLVAQKLPESESHRPSEYAAPHDSSRVFSTSGQNFYGFDLEHLKSILKTDGERLVSHLLGHTPKAALSTHKEKRYGTKGSFALTVQGPKAGKWNDFEAGEGGDIFKLVARELKLKEFKEQLDYVASFYGLSPERHLNSKRPEIDVAKASASKDSLKENEIDQQKLEQIKKAYAMSTPIVGSLAERYLREHRGIEGVLPDSLRFIACYGRDNLPAMAAFSTNVEGTPTGMQLTYLDHSTGKKAEIDVNKRSYGSIKGSSVVIKEGSGRTFVAEGIETALSVAVAVPKDSKVLAVLGSSNFANIRAEKGQEIIICADNDGGKQPVLKALEKAIARIEEQGAHVAVIKPTKEGQDYNDVLIEEGREGVARYLGQAQKALDDKLVVKEPVTKPELTSNALEAPLKAALLEDFKRVYQKQFKKDPTPELLNSRSEQISLAAVYLLRSGPYPLMEDQAKKREAVLARAGHELKATPERTLDHYRALKKDLAGTLEGLVASIKHGQRLAIIEGRLIEQDVLNGGNGQRRWEISNPAKQELLSHNELYEKIKIDYQATGMDKNQTEQMAVLHIRYTEMFGKAPDQNVMDNLKEISAHLCERKLELLNGKDLSHDSDKTLKTSYILAREETTLLRAKSMKTFSNSKILELQQTSMDELRNDSKILQQNTSRGSELER